MVKPVYYSAVHRGFYDPDSGVPVPVDAQEVAWATYVDLFAGQAQGAQIVPGPGGAPVLEWPPEPTPAEVLTRWREVTSVTAYQAKAALFNRGLLDEADAVALAAGGLTLLAWRTATTFQRNATSIGQLAPAIGITTPEDLDDLFREAAAITA